MVMNLNEEINPIEANLKWAIGKKRREEGGFNGWEKIRESLEKGSPKLRVGILPDGKIIAREGTKIFSVEDKEIGICNKWNIWTKCKCASCNGLCEVLVSLKLEQRLN